MRMCGADVMREMKKKDAMRSDLRSLQTNNDQLQPITVAVSEMTIDDRDLDTSPMAKTSN